MKSRNRHPIVWSQVTAGLLVLAIITAAAVVAAWPIYGTQRAALAAAAALAIGTGTVLAGWALRWRWWQTAIIAGATYVLTVVPVAIPSAMTSPQRFLAGIGTGVMDIVQGWKRLLTIEVPAADYQSVLVPFYFTVTLCALVAAALIVRGGRWAPFAVVPMLAMPLFGAFFGTSHTLPDMRIGPFQLPAPAHVILAVASVAVCAAWLLLRARIARAAAIRAARSRTGAARLSATAGSFALRRQLLASTIVIVALGSALAAAPLASAWGDREVARDDADPLLMLQQQASPLSSYREWFRADQFDESLFSVTGDTGVDRVRIATLNAYDGAVFHVAADADASRFNRQPQVQSGDVRITINAGYEGVWVPLVTAQGGAPEFDGARASLLADSYYASTALDAGVVVEGQDPQSVSGLRAGDTYTVSAAPAPDAEAFAGMTGGDPLISSETHPALAAWADSQELERSGASLIELVERMRERGYISHSTVEGPNSTAWVSAIEARTPYTFYGSRAGHSAARVEELFESLLEQQERAGEGADDAMLVAAIGDDEQFAVAAALLANHLGFESRVVVGVRLGDQGGDWAVPPCEDTCSGQNVTAWAEARGLGGDWVVLDATPQHTVPPSLIEEGQTPPEHPTEPEQVEAQVIDPPTSLSETVTESTPETSTEETPWLQSNMRLIMAITTYVVGAILLLLPFLVFPLAKRAHRRWRRRVAVPEVAMVGAWEELMDRYVDAGIEVPAGLTRAETSDVLDRPAATAVAAIVDRAVFAEHPPSREASEGLWEILDEETRSLRSEMPLSRRIRAVFTPSSFTRTLRAQRKDEVSTLRRKDSHDSD